MANLEQMQKDWVNFFQNTPIGTTLDWAGGTVTLEDRNGLKVARYIDSTGRYHLFSQNTPLDIVAGFSPEIASSWSNSYGWSPSGIQNTTRDVTPPADNNNTGYQGAGMLTTNVGNNEMLNNLATANFPAATAEQALGQGLGGASGLVSNYRPAAYPNFTPSETNAPSSSDYINYTPNQPMAQVQTPDYQMKNDSPDYKGLMGGDYNALQTALTTPGQIAATNAYNTGNRNLNNTMGGNGLYGSSIMATQANEGINREYMNATATNAANAAATRYTQQAADLANQNNFNTNIYGQQMTQNQNMNAYNQNNSQLNMTQNQNLYNAGLTDAGRQQDYNLAAMEYGNNQTEQQRQWANQQALEQFQYQIANGQYTNAQQEAMMNQYLALAGLGAPLTTANNQIQASQDAADQAAIDQLIAGLLGTVGTVGSAYFLS